MTTPITANQAAPGAPLMAGDATDPFLKMFELAISNENGVEKLEKLMELQARNQKEQARQEFFGALAGFQADCPTIKKTKQGHNCKYASLDDIAESIKPFLVKWGFSYRFEQKQDPAISVKCILTHSSGHSESSVMTGLADNSGKKNSIQSIASTFTYLRRYTLQGVTGIATADEDIDGRLDSLPPKKEALPEPPGEFNFYPDDKFLHYFPKWKLGIEAGDISAQGVINKIESSGFTMTDEQVSQIHLIKVAA